MKKFVPTNEWQDVKPDHVLPPGCEIRMSMGDSGIQARLRVVKAWPSTRDVCRAASRRTIATVTALVVGVLVVLGALTWVWL